MLATLVITLGLKWKVSLHAAVAAGAVVILVVTYGPWLALLALAVAYVAWSRVELCDHTTAQVLVGTLIGALAADCSTALELLLR